VNGEVFVVGSERDTRIRVAEILTSAGIDDVVPCANIAVSEDSSPPSLIVVCDREAALLCAQAREIPALMEIPILAVVPALPADAAAAALAAGADEVVVGEPSAAILGRRARNLIVNLELRRSLRELDGMERALLDIHDLMSRGGDSPETLRDILLIALDTIGFERASLIAHVEGSAHGYVVAATDDPHLQQFTLVMSDYPELEEALRSQAPVLIGDVAAHPLTAPIAEDLRARAVASLAVFPVVWRASSLGAVRFRSRKSEPPLSARRIRFASVLASHLAALIRHGAVMEQLREQTRRISRAKYEAERRLRTIESLKEHFEASADGVVVLDDEGRILFVNGTAEAITGFARDGLIGSPLTDLVPIEAREPLEVVIRSVLAGTNLEAFDLDLTTTSGHTICVSVTTSTVLSRSGAVILSFRDVTDQRALESELEHTKDFLERLIGSTVDAIIASNMRGDVILFNAGAERIYGYGAEEVLGQISVWDLYPEGAAAQVLRMLRSEEHGGVGKLEQTRREILTRSGELVPVNMTASIVYDDGEEVATVGIFTDLRDRLRMEERLVLAQQALRDQEKQAAIAQLAGAAAHELNQPLTSILASAELLARHIAGDDAAVRRVSTITSEAERMAEIVKRIGRITRFETMEYVGSAEILDLERSARAGTNPGTASPAPAEDRESEPASEAPATESDQGEVREEQRAADRTARIRIGSDGLGET
jgi:PAS domain S-box-containing protein